MLASFNRRRRMKADSRQIPQWAVPNLGERFRSLRKLVKSCSWPHYSQK